MNQNGNETTQLTVPAQQTAVVALKADARRKSFAALVKESTEIVAITNFSGYQQCHAAEQKLVKARTELTAEAKTTREGAVKFQKDVLALEKDLLQIMEPEETRLKALKNEHNTRIERERQAKVDAEAARLEMVRANIARLTELPGTLVGKRSQDIADALAILQSEDVGDWCQEFRPEANAAKMRAISSVALMLDGTRAQESAAIELAARQEAERLELARLRAEADERDRRAAVEEKQRLQDESDRQAKIALAEKESRERIEAEQRAAKAIRDEADRVAEVTRQAKLAEIIAEQEADREKRRLEIAASEKERKERYAAESAKIDRENEAIRLAAKAQADRDAALRAESVRQEDERRAIEREKQELLATDGLIGAVRRRIGDDPRYAGIAAAIDEYMGPGRPIAKPAKRAAA